MKRTISQFLVFALIVASCIPLATAGGDPAFAPRVAGAAEIADSNATGFNYNGEFYMSDALFDLLAKPRLEMTYRIDSGMPVTNPYFDDFFVREYFGPGDFGDDYPSFDVGPYAVSLGRDAYHYFNKTSEFASLHPGAKEDLLAAYNYIYDTWGSLDRWPAHNVDDPSESTKFIAQIATWLLADLGITEAKSTRQGYGYIDKYVDQVISFTSANPGYIGRGAVPDIVYLAHEGYPPESPMCSPQIVPIYGGMPTPTPTPVFEIEPYSITKTVEGKVIASWLYGNYGFADQIEILGSVSFDLYKAEDYPGGGALMATMLVGSEIDLGILPYGDYVVVERLEGIAAGIFKPHADKHISISENGMAGLGDYIDQSAEYWSGHDTIPAGSLGFKVMYRLEGDAEPMRDSVFEDCHVKNVSGSSGTYGELHSSFSGHCGSLSLGGPTDGGTQSLNYFDKTSEFVAAKGVGAKNDITHALDYIHKTWGSVDQWPTAADIADEDAAASTKLIASIAIWLLVGDGIIEAKSDYAYINDCVDETLAYVAGIEGPQHPVITDIVFLAADGYPYINLLDCEPQIVPTYTYENKLNSAPAHPASLTGHVRSYNPGSPTTIRLMQGGEEAYAAAIPGEPGFGQKTQDFTFWGVAPGAYTLEITKPGHASFTVQAVIVGDGDVDLAEDSRPGAQLMELRCGDINGDSMVNNADLAMLWQADNYNKSVAQAADPQCDLDGDGLINNADLAILWLASNFNKGPVVVAGEQAT